MRLGETLYVLGFLALLLCLTASWVQARDVHPAPEIYTEVVGDLRVQVLAPTLVRFEVRGPKGFEDRTTFHIVNRDDWPGDVVRKSDREDAIVLETSTAVVVVGRNAKTLHDVRIEDKEGKLLWEFTGLPGNKVALPKANEPVMAFTIADTPRVVPSPWGFNPQPDSNKEHRETNGWDFSNDSPDVYVFLPNNDHRRLRADFVRLTSRPEMVPLAALGAWDSRYYPYSEVTALAQIDGYHQRNLPLDVLVVDTDWRAAASGMGYDVNTHLFPDMERFLRRAHERNVLVVFNDHPEPTRTAGADNHVLHPDEVSYRSENLKRFLAMGLDAWWYDRNWAKTVVPPPGFTHEVMGMALYADAYRTVYPERRLFMMSNVDGIWNGQVTGPSNIAAHRYSVQWTGDTHGGQELIFQEVRNTVERGETGLIGYLSTDLGGHQTLSAFISDREYIRWIQAGSLLPIFRLHVAAGDTGRMPWLRGETVTEIYRDYLNLRYRLLPVFYRLAYEHYATGMPIARAMTFYWPEYESADRYDQYMLGDDLLVAPVIENTVITPVPGDWLSVDGQPGLKAEYFNNMNLAGQPVVTIIHETVDFDWETRAPFPQVRGDRFSVRFTGTITNKSAENVTLGVWSDDGARLYIDGELVLDEWVPKVASAAMASVVLEPGRSYAIRLEYFDDVGDARVRLGYVTGDTQSSKPRTVFIPEGEWIYTVTGETVYGPQTITVQCDIRQMPIFVRKGAVIPLADETLTVQGSDWSHLTLDFYPSTRQFAETYLYEDDTMSNAYELGQFRTTALSTSFEGGKAILRIGAAQGAFDGPRAFNEREWTVRVHRPGGWGELTGVTVNGKSAPFTKIPRDPHAMPLDNEGGATDGDVYIVRLRARVDEAQELVFTFDHPVDPPVPAGNYEGPRVQMVIHTGRAGDTTTTGAQVVQGELTVVLSHWYAPQDVMEAVLMVYPVRGGEVQGQLGELLYSGSEVPAALPIDTRQLADGTYELELRVGSRDGRVSSSRQRIIVRNWSVLLDPFSPPEPMGWFGVLDRSLTVYETPGWDYATDDPAAFFDDAARRVWLGDGTGHLVWEYPGLRRIIVTAYTRNTELPSFAIGVSENQDEWIGLAWQMEDIATSPSGWHQIRVYADISEPAEVRYVRVSVGDGLDGTILQLGAVELVREAPASGR